MLSVADLLSIATLAVGSISSVVLSKMLLKFYSTILFADTNIFTHLNRAAVVAIQVMVQSRVRQGWTGQGFFPTGRGGAGQG